MKQTDLEKLLALLMFSLYHYGVQRRQSER